MEEKPPTKGMSPVAGITMYNFLYWLLRYHCELENLQTLPAGQLLYLAQEFEKSRPDTEHRTPKAWLEGFEKLFSIPTPEDDYASARKLVYR